MLKRQRHRFVRKAHGRCAPLAIPPDGNAPIKRPAAINRAIPVRRPEDIIAAQAAAVSEAATAAHQANRLKVAAREWPIDRQINKADIGDDDPMVLEPIESDLL